MLDYTKKSERVHSFESALATSVVGQPEAVEAVSNMYQTFCAGLNPPNHPVCNLIFLGPTGSGKTHTIEAASEILFGTRKAVIRVDCAEFQHSHEIAKLIGSPPGYLGHRETHPLITQEALAQFHTEKLKLSFLLFDEIEKASDSLWQLLLGMLDKATLTLGDNRRVDLSQTVIYLTSNLGGEEITQLNRGGLGFHQTHHKNSDLHERIKTLALTAAQRKFSPEFMNRLDRVVIFGPLHRPDLEKIVDLELMEVQNRLLDSPHSIMITVSESVKKFLLRNGTDERYGARPLKRCVEHYIVRPLANLIESGQLKVADIIKIDLKNQKWSFEKDGQNDALLARLFPKPDPKPIEVIATQEVKAEPVQSEIPNLIPEKLAPVFKPKRRSGLWRL